MFKDTGFNFSRRHKSPSIFALILIFYSSLFSLFPPLLFKTPLQIPQKSTENHKQSLSAKRLYSLNLLKMAISLGIFPSLLATETPSLANSFSVSLLPAVPTYRSLRSVRFWTSATVSKSATESKKREPRGIMKPRPVSPEMQALVGQSEIPRTQALKKIWAYIKQNNLQVYSLCLNPLSLSNAV